MPDLHICEACQKRGPQKILKCLHTLCSDCIEEKVDANNTVVCPKCTMVTPSPGHGRVLVRSLPDIVQHDPGHSHGDDDCMQLDQLKCAPVSYCEECEDVVAIATCTQCTIHLCDLHAKAHQASKKTKQHKLITLGTAPSQLAASQTDSRTMFRNCSLHAAAPLTTYCTHCRQLMCQKCHTHHTHTQNHGEYILPIDQASQRIRRDVKSAIARHYSDQNEDSMLAEAVQKISQSISDLNDRTLDVSEKITEYFDGLVETLRERQKQLLTELDELSWRKGQPLEEQKLQLMSSIEAGQNVACLSEKCNDDINVLKVGGWLLDKLQELRKVVEIDLTPCVTSNLSFRHDGDEKILSAMKQLGRVQDIGPVAANSTLTCPSEINVADGVVVVSVELKDAEK